MQTATFAIGCGVLFGLTVVACGGSIIDGDDDDDGDCVGGAGGGHAGTTAYAVGSTVGTGVVTVVSSTVGTTAGGGMCPDDPGFQGCGSSVGSTGATMTTCGVHYCDPQGGPPLFQRQCDSETGTCTCTGPDGACSCEWNGNCGTPCCGDPPSGP